MHAHTQDAVADAVTQQLEKPAGNTHDAIAASAAAGVAKAQEVAEGNTDSKGTNTPTVAATEPTSAASVTSKPSAVEQAALDASYKSGDSPYEISEGVTNEAAVKAAADRVYGDK